MRHGPDPLDRLPPQFVLLPLSWRKGARRERIRRKGDVAKALQQADHEEGRLVERKLPMSFSWVFRACISETSNAGMAGSRTITHLLAEAHTRPSVEGQEDKRVGQVVLLVTVMDPPLRIEDVRFGPPAVSALHQDGDQRHAADIECRQVFSAKKPIRMRDFRDALGTLWNVISYPARRIRPDRCLGALFHVRRHRWH